MGKDNTKEKERLESKIGEEVASWVMTLGEKTLFLQYTMRINGLLETRQAIVNTMMLARGLDPEKYMLDVEAGVIRRKETENVAAKSG